MMRGYRKTDFQQQSNASSSDAQVLPPPVYKKNRRSVDSPLDSFVIGTLMFYMCRSSCIVEIINLATSKRVQIIGNASGITNRVGVKNLPIARPHYKAIQVNLDRAAILYPNGSLCIIQPRHLIPSFSQ